MGDKKRFVPVRGTEEKIAANVMGFNNGYLYFATDTGHIYLDYVDENGNQVARAPVGGVSGGSGNSGIYYANKTLTADEKLETTIIFPINTLESDTYPLKDDLIINISEGSFYRVTNPSPLTSSVEATRLTIAGGGGGVSTLAEDIDLIIEPLATVNLINGQSANVYFTATSAKNAKGNEIDRQLTITYTLAYTEDGTNYTTYKTDRLLVVSGERTAFDFGQYARLSSSSKLTLKATQANAEGSITRSIEFSTSKLELTPDSTFSNLSTFDPAALSLRCNAIGSMNKIVEYYFDDMDTPFYTELLTSSDAENRIVNVQQKGGNKVSLTHGNHKVAIRLFQSINGVKGIEVTPLIFEVALNDGLSNKPIIWLGDYKDTYFNYDVIQIPFRVYDPSNTTAATVHFKKDNKELDNSPQIITDNSKFSYFEIADAEIDVLNRYSITCGEGNNEVSRDIEITVVQDPERTDFGVQKTNFLTYMLNTVGSGRSNNESEIKRQTLNYTNPNTNEIIPAKLTNFNWYNNGWVRGTDNKTCLRISNGAQVSIPVGQMKFAAENGSSTEIAHTIELQFKIRNVQDYSNLIRNITRYQNDADLFAAFYDTENNSYKTSYTNYDSFLAWYLKENNIPFTDSSGVQRNLEYDDLEFDYIQKQINLNNVFCGYYTGDTSSVVGMCLGPQDMFFSNGTNTVSASYVEDEIVSLSIVYQHGQTSAQKLIMIYINGILTSVIKNTQGAFTIESDKIVFNSNACDIDLYKIRIYSTSLNVNDIVMNYAADFENVDIYDQNKLAKSNDIINEYYFDYNEMLNYNINHPNAPLMPYIIFDTTQTYDKTRQKLSYSKAVKLNIGVEFVNTQLDLAYTSGELEDLAKQDGLWKDGDNQEKKAAAVKKYYQHHCPSWKSVSGVNMAVQGTSSEFYPRRNYKLKAKTSYDEDGEDRVHIFLNRGPFAADYEADQLGLTEDKYILSNDAYNASQTYYADENGETVITFNENNPYKYNTYYVKNPAWVELGKEKTRQKYWYMNNYTTGTTKWTMKIDYMESSGSYNMGFANLVKNGYSKHPLDDYNSAGAFQVEDPENTVISKATSYKEGTKYYYMTHKGAWKIADGSDEPFTITSAEDFAKSPLELWIDQEAGSNIKILVTEAQAAAYNAAHGTSISSTINNAASQSGLSTSELEQYAGYWFEMVPSYKAFTIPNTSDYRTSVGGFRVLAFHKKFLQDGSIYYQYIGMYNMLLDKGSDEVYGFKPDKTSGATPLQKFIKNKKVNKIAECWEMENNNRTYCSFRDPDKRKDLTFKAFEMKNGQKTYKLNSVGSAPLVADSFEYRYNADADILDYIMDPIKESDKYNSEDAQAYMASNNVDFLFDGNDKTKNFDVRANFLWDKYKNWEKACQWVWSTCTDYVVSQGQYEPTVVGNTLWVANTFYVISGNDYIADTGATWDASTTYYTRSWDEASEMYAYADAHAVDSAHLFNATNKNNFYIQVNGSYVSCANEPEFNDSVTYYELVNYTDEQMATLEAQNKVDRLVVPAGDTFDANAEYYTYDGTQINGHATTKVNITAEQFAANPTDYYVGTTITYKGKSYKYDTIEYRGDKFINELTKHFDLEYMATYFVMTEVFECYDSRGKNAMMASWGPQESGGDYIWYPIFYDIDTQLGVNNTGIPSFEYNVDATEDGNYSTSDSVLWNNFYKYFKSSAIVSKYKHLKGVNAGVQWPALPNPPLQSVDYIEGWYNTDPEVCNAIVMRGKRPIVAKNLDEYYKYITITNGSNQQALANGLIGHLASNDSGDQTVDADGQYFYMLQGDRSLSRRQFLANRIEYIDSWLNQGNYQRGGYNRIRGRVAANNASKTSDIWVETQQDPYYDQEGKKRHLFDAEYWLTLTPTHSSYVTLGDDNEAYPSQKYDGIHPLKFEISAIESGVRTSAGYPEQLLYIYGINNMSDLGDMSKLYWQEFAIEGNASKLTSLKFGYDGIMYDDATDPNHENPISYKNNNVNNPSFGAAAQEGVTGLPLLKYMNVSNIQLRQGSAVLDLTSCEKLENFRATGSNYSEVKFAAGVALNTLYLPTALTTLKLTEVRLLKNLITNYQIPQLNNEGELVAQPGLYLEGMFENNITGITTLNILGSGMGYDSYKLLKKYYDIRKQQTASNSNIQMTKVQWSPFIQVSEDEDWDASAFYFEDNGHYGLVPYTHNVDVWPIKVPNGEIYRLDTDKLTTPINSIGDFNISLFNADVNQIDDTALEMLNTFGSDSQLFRTDDNNIVPNITGFIYIKNTTAVDEVTIRNQLQPKFPNLTFFFANVNEAYTAKFLLMDADEGENGTYTLIGSQTIESGWFSDPIALYGDISRLKQNHDFYGWAESNSLNATLLASLDGTKVWPTKTLDSNKHTYYFYAICPIHSWTVNFYDKNILVDTVYVPHGTAIDGPNIYPEVDDSNLPVDETYQLLGFNRNANASTAMNLSEFNIISDTNFYAIWNAEPISVYANVHPEWFEVTNANSNIDGVSGCAIKLIKNAKGKLTIPAIMNNKKVISYGSTSAQSKDEHLADVTHVFFAKDDQTSEANILEIQACTFHSCNKLQYFEFTNSLKYIRDRAFQVVSNLKDSSTIAGNIKLISQFAFTNAFNPMGAQTRDIFIGGNITSLGTSAFSAQNSFSDNTLIFNFGSSTQKFNYDLMSTNMLLNGNISKINKINIWTDVVYDKDALIKKLFNVTQYDVSMLDKVNIMNS